jgi:monoamine oxidase
MYQGKAMKEEGPVSRRALFRMIGTVAGSAIMYDAMRSLGYAAESGYTGPIKLSGDPKGATVLILGAGVSGLAAALELRNAGYKVQLLEYQNRPGGRNWSIRGGDVLHELGGYTQRCEFDSGLYFNPGPWRLPYHHRAILDYCKRLNVAVEPFNHLNNNAYVHNSGAFGGKPRRFREIQADFYGHVSELLARCTAQNKLDQAITQEDREMLLEALKGWGALNDKYEYVRGIGTSDRRGYDIDPGSGVGADGVPSEPMALRDILQARMWSAIPLSLQYDFSPTMFQPVGGMGMISAAFARELGPIIKYNCKVIDIKQDSSGVTVTHVDPERGGPPSTAKAQWCVNCICGSALSTIPMQVGAPMRNAINAIADYGPAFKAGLQFKRRFWEEDEDIYGGITYTDLPIEIIGYPNTQYLSSGKAILLGAYSIDSQHAYEMTSKSPEERMKVIVDNGAQIHPQYRTEFENGVSVGWHRLPWALGCEPSWTEEKRRRYYKDLYAFDGRIVLAGGHVGGIWQEQAILSGLDAVKRLHQRVMAGSGDKA